MTDQNDPFESAIGFDAILADIEAFKCALGEFSDNATEVMAASVRLQTLMLDDARLTMGELASGLAKNARNRRAERVFDE